MRIAKNLESDSTDKYLELINQKLSNSNFLQGDQMGILDLSLYGMLNVFSSEPRLDSVQRMLDKSPKFSSWYGLMHQKVGDIAWR